MKQQSSVKSRDQIVPKTHQPRQGTRALQSHISCLLQNLPEALALLVPLLNLVIKRYNTKNPIIKTKPKTVLGKVSWQFRSSQEPRVSNTSWRRPYVSKASRKSLWYRLQSNMTRSNVEERSNGVSKTIWLNFLYERWAILQPITHIFLFHSDMLVLSHVKITLIIGRWDFH